MIGNSDAHPRRIETSFISDMPNHTTFEITGAANELDPAGLQTFSASSKLICHLILATYLHLGKPEHPRNFFPIF